MVPDNSDVAVKSLSRRIAQRVRAWLSIPSVESTSSVGVADTDWDALHNAWFELSTTRIDAYNDVLDMESSVEEVSVALDILSDEAANSEGGVRKPFKLVYSDSVPSEVRTRLEDTLERCRIYEKAFAFARDLLLFGDNFIQFVVDDQFSIARLMYMPPKSMRRYETEDGLLRDGSEQGEWAFEQYKPGTSQFITGFFPWQIEHLRWNRSGNSKYGRSLFYTARTAWRKLRAMEEALCVNWLTRAFARLLFQLDVTGKSSKEASRYIKQFKTSLETQRVASGVLGDEQMSVVKDVFIGKGYHDFAGRPHEGLTEVSVLDTSSTGFSSLDPIEYYRSKVIMAGRTPRAYLGLEKDINAKATLGYEDRRFARTIRRIQAVVSELIDHTVILQMVLDGLNPMQYEIYAEWVNPSREDAEEGARTLFLLARADEIYGKLGVVDQDYIATNHVGMTQDQWEQVKKRVGTQIRLANIPSDNGDQQNVIEPVTDPAQVS